MMPELEITKIADGFAMAYDVPGVNEPTISAIDQEKKAGNEDLAALTDEAIQSPNILVPISTDEHGDPIEDDGCGDGRPVNAIFALTEGGKQLFKRSLNRAKVFGGGLVMTAAMHIGFGNAKGNTLNQVMDNSLEVLADKEIDFGAHTDNHAHGANCGCGAIDKAPLIVAAAAHFRTKISATIASMDIDTAGLEETLDAYASYAREIAGQEYSGREVMDEIVDNGKLVKELADGHLETRVLLNFVKGYTVDQEFVRQYTGGRAQVFAVDIPRLQQLADRQYDDPAERHRAFLSELVYTLATAAVLTKGDLPVYAIQHAQQFVLAA